MHPVSQDLPDYLKSKYSIIHRKFKRTSGKHYKPPLTQGISVDAPDCFRLKGVPVLTAEFRNHLNDNTQFGGEEKLSQASQCYKATIRNLSLQLTEDLATCSKAGLATGQRRPGKFTPITPIISRNLSSDQEALQNYLEKMPKPRIKSSRRNSNSSTSTNFYRVAKASPKPQKVYQFECINPRILTQKESRLIYNI